MGKKKLVLLVDDNEDLGRSYKELLELNLDCCVICYTTGNRAIKDITAGNVSYDLAIVDETLANRDDLVPWNRTTGEDVIHTFRELYSGVPVISLSGTGRDSPNADYTITKFETPSENVIELCKRLLDLDKN